MTPAGPLAGLGASTSDPMKWVRPGFMTRSAASWTMSSHKRRS
jgi:hypothetical protein